MLRGGTCAASVAACATPAVTHLTRFAAVVLAAIIITASFAPSARAQFARPGQLPAIDGETRAAIVDSITAVIDSVYVLEEPAKRIVAKLRQSFVAGDYDELNDPAEFARRLEQDAQAVNHDGHFRIRAMPPLAPEVVADQREDPVELERRRRMNRARNYGFKRAEVLAGGVGYLRFDEFSRGDEAYEVAAAAMNFLANSNAVILDLRYNGGGSASMIRFLCGYLFSENTHLVNWDSRAPKETIQSYSADYVPGRRLVDQPVYILTSGRTFSAAEEFTFDLRNLERATVVGDTTGGGGHTVAGFEFSFAGFRMGIRVPHSRAYNPKNNEGWEGIGVMPHIAVPAEKALEVAHADALRKLIADQTDDGHRSSLEWALRDAESRANPIDLSAKAMQEYQGTYGPRRIFSDDGQLWYQRDDQPSLKLAPMGEDLFRVGDLEYFRLRFERNSDGRIVKIIGVYDNGATDEHERDGAESAKTQSP